MGKTENYQQCTVLKKILGVCLEVQREYQKDHNRGLNHIDHEVENQVAYPVCELVQADNIQVVADLIEPFLSKKKCLP